MSDTHTHAHTQTHTHTTLIFVSEETWQEIRFMILVSEILSLTSRRNYLVLYAEFTASLQSKCDFDNPFLNLTLDELKYLQSTQDTSADPLQSALTSQASHSSLCDLLTQLFPVPLMSFSLFFSSLHTDGWSPLYVTVLQCLFKALLCWCCFNPQVKRSPPPSMPRAVMSHGKGPASNGRHCTA